MAINNHKKKAEHIDKKMDPGNRGRGGGGIGPPTKAEGGVLPPPTNSRSLGFPVCHDCGTEFGASLNGTLEGQQDNDVGEVQLSQVGKDPRQLLIGQQLKDLRHLAQACEKA